jgi:hypothetical protein
MLKSKNHDNASSIKAPKKLHKTQNPKPEKKLFELKFPINKNPVIKI